MPLAVTYVRDSSDTVHLSVDPETMTDHSTLSEFSVDATETYKELTKKRWEALSNEIEFMPFTIEELQNNYPSHLLKQVQEVSDREWREKLLNKNSTLNTNPTDLGQAVYFKSTDYYFEHTPDGTRIIITCFENPVTLTTTERIENQTEKALLLRGLGTFSPYQAFLMDEQDIGNLTPVFETPFEKDDLRKKLSNGGLQAIKPYLDEHLNSRQRFDLYTVLTEGREIACIPITNEYVYPLIEVIASYYEFDTHMMPRACSVIITDDEHLYHQAIDFTCEPLEPYSEEYHREFGRILKYPKEQINFYIENKDKAGDISRYSMEKMLQMKKEGKITEVDMAFSELSPFVPSGEEEAIYNAIELGKKYYNAVIALPNQIGLEPIDELLENKEYSIPKRMLTVQPSD